MMQPGTDGDDRLMGVRLGAERLLRDLIHDKTGVHFDDSKLGTLGEKIAPLVIERGFESFLDYYYLLKFDAEAAEEWSRLANALSVQETYFWREMDQVHALSDAVLPELARSRPGLPIRIWSAACATGEEALSIAIRLDRDGWFERAPIEIYASDISTTALERARKGIYRDRSFRALPADLKERYFERDGKEWRIDAAIHGRVKWQQANLLNGAEVAPLARAPVIFCRNVFIYFSPESVRKVVDLFAANMQVPAFLLTGASESLLKITDDFELDEIGGCFAYVKRR